MKKGIRITQTKKAKKKHGFLKRMTTHNGKKVLKRRRVTKRRKLTV